MFLSSMIISISWRSTELAGCEFIFFFSLSNNSAGCTLESPTTCATRATITRVVRVQVQGIKTKHVRIRRSPAPRPSHPLSPRGNNRNGGGGGVGTCNFRTAADDTFRGFDLGKTYLSRAAEK